MVGSLSERDERDDRGRAEIRALLVLDGLPRVGPRTVRALVDRFGSARAALDAPSRAFARLAGRAAAEERRRPAAGKQADEALARARRTGMSVLGWDAPGYPASLRHLADPPPVLFLRGRVELLGARSVAVVGARRATGRAREVAERIGARLADAGIVVASGMALGVDGAAHRGALARGGETLAVLGTGADVVYPRAHAALVRKVLQRGLLVSEFSPGTPALPHHFPRRNRILAALGSATVVVEAADRSGALITVDHALDLGREVWVVPGPIERPACAGSNRLLAEGARPILSVEHLVGALAPGAPDRKERSDDARPAGGVPAPPTGVGARVLASLDAAPMSGDELAARLEVPVDEVLAALTALELDGTVRRLSGMRYGVAA